MVGSEAEKSSSSEYQKQKDIETARKVCTDINIFHEYLRSEGLIVTDLMCKESGQEDIDIAFGRYSCRKKRKVTA